MKNDQKRFYWGSATASHQVEGGTWNDWSEWEKKNANRLAKEAKSRWEIWQQERFPEMFFPENYISGVACDHYNRYAEDFDLVKKGGQSAYRFSLEWSRIEPEEGKFNDKELQHYVDVIKALRARELEPFVTLWHWTLPIWLRDKGGLLASDFPDVFSRYAKRVGEALRGEVTFFMTVNEPNSIIWNGYGSGIWPPQKKNIFLVREAYKNLAKAHTEAYRVMKEVAPESQVGFTEIFMFFEPKKKDSWIQKLFARWAWRAGNERFLSRVPGLYDFLGVQNYFSRRIGCFGFVKDKASFSKYRSDLGWEICPGSLEGVLRECARYNVPIYVTEDGLADADERLRGEFLQFRIAGMRRAMIAGTDVRGYFVWSLLDNFEWDKGFWPKFGLVEVDRKTLERRPRRSFYIYKEIIKNPNSII